MKLTEIKSNNKPQLLQKKDVIGSAAFPQIRILKAESFVKENQDG